jgi:probable rRNA maturation factor
MTEWLLEEALGLSAYELGIELISGREMARRNEEFLNHSGSTDVITFDYREGYEEGAGASRELAGDIWVSITDAEEQAREFETSWQEELARYIIHGVLHLRGFDDLEPSKRKEMKREENGLLRAARRAFDLARIRG